MLMQSVIVQLLTTAVIDRGAHVIFTHTGMGLCVGCVVKGNEHALGLIASRVLLAASMTSSCCLVGLCSCGMQTTSTW